MGRCPALPGLNVVFLEANVHITAGMWCYISPLCPLNALHFDKIHNIQVPDSVKMTRITQSDSESIQKYRPDSKRALTKCSDYPGPTRPYPALACTYNENSSVAGKM